MVNFESLLTRADVPTLERLIGAPAVKLLKALDPELVRGNSLRAILTAMRPPARLLLEQDAWLELVDLLSEEEAAELSVYCNIADKNDPWTALKVIRLGRRTSLHKTVNSFFCLSAPEPEVGEVETSENKIQPSYSMFAHQRRACRESMAKLRSDDRRVILHMPTGAGKTRTAMHIIAQHLVANEPTAVIWLAYSEELCDQAVSEFQRAWHNLGNRTLKVVRFWGKHEQDPKSCNDGLIVAGLGKTFSRAMANIQFIARLAESVSLIVIDEAHQAVARSYKLVLNTLQSKRPDTSLLGLTATPGRSWDDLEEDRELASFFAGQKVSLSVPGYSNPIDFLIDKGYLAKPSFRTLFSEGGVTLSEKDLRAIEVDLDVSGDILRRLGEDEVRNLHILNEVEKLADRHSRILVFAASVENALILSTALQAHGRVDANVITGQTPDHERHRIIRWYRSEGRSSRVLCNYGVLTTGFDAPRTSAAVIARPTKSLVLWSQMVGRAIRGVRAAGNDTAEIVTVVDTRLPGFGSLAEAFVNWEDAGWDNHMT